MRYTWKEGESGNSNHFPPTLLFSDFIRRTSQPYSFCHAALGAAIGLDYVFDGPSTDRTTGIGHLLEFQPTCVA